MPKQPHLAERGKPSGRASIAYLAGQPGRVPFVPSTPHLTPSPAPPRSPDSRREVFPALSAPPHRKGECGKLCSWKTRGCGKVDGRLVGCRCGRCESPGAAADRAAIRPTSPGLSQGSDESRTQQLGTLSATAAAPGLGHRQPRRPRPASRPILAPDQPAGLPLPQAKRPGSCLPRPPDGIPGASDQAGPGPSTRSTPCTCVHDRCPLDTPTPASPWPAPPDPDWAAALHFGSRARVSLRARRPPRARRAKAGPRIDIDPR